MEKLTSTINVGDVIMFTPLNNVPPFNSFFQDEQVKKPSSNGYSKRNAAIKISHANVKFSHWPAFEPSTAELKE